MGFHDKSDSDSLGSRTKSLLARFIFAIVALAAAAACAAVFLAAIGLFDLSGATNIAIGGSSFSLDLNALTWLERGSVAGVAVVVGLLFLVLMFRSFAPKRRENGIHLLQSDERGFVLLDSRGIATIAEHAAMAVPGVVDVHVRVRGSGTSPVRLRVEMGIVPGAAVKQSGIDAQGAVRDAVERLAGIDVKDVTIRAHVLEPEALTRILE